MNNGLRGFPGVAPPDFEQVRLNNTGLQLEDTGGDHTVTVKIDENNTQNRTLKFALGDFDRKISFVLDDVTISGTNLGDQYITLAGDFTGGSLGPGVETTVTGYLAPAAITGQDAESTVADDDLILISDTSESAALNKMTRANFLGGTLPAANGSNLTTLNASQLASGTVPDARFPATLPAASGANLTALNATQLTSGTVPGARIPYVCLTDVKTANTAGGTFTSGAWQTRTLQTETDAQGVCTLSSNQFTLAAGTYRIRASAPAYLCARHKARLYNTTDTADILIGTSEWAVTASGSSTRSLITGEFTIAASKALEIQHWCGTSQATNGFGVESNFDSKSEVYTVVELWKVG